jgi:Family of unknown function (DUF6535)
MDVPARTPPSLAPPPSPCRTKHHHRQAFQPSTSAVRVNILWFLNLVLRLTCALLVTLMQQWVRRYLQASQHRYGWTQYVRHGSDAVKILYSVSISTLASMRLGCLILAWFRYRVLTGSIAYLRLITLRGRCHRPKCLTHALSRSCFSPVTTTSIFGVCRCLRFPPTSLRKACSTTSDCLDTRTRKLRGKRGGDEFGFETVCSICT